MTIFPRLKEFGAIITAIFITFSINGVNLSLNQTILVGNMVFLLIVISSVARVERLMEEK